MFYPLPSDTSYDIGGWNPPDTWDHKGAWRIYETIVNDHSRTLLLGELFHSYKDVIDGQISIHMEKIKDHERSINYCLTMIKGLKKLKNEC